MIEVKVSGLTELQEKLEKMPGIVAARLLREGMRKSTNIWRIEMSRTAPRLAMPKMSANPKQVRLPGYLARHIIIESTTRADAVEGIAEVGPTKSAFYANFLEFGTRKMFAQPFIRRAYESLKGAVLARFVDEGKKIVAEEAR